MAAIFANASTMSSSMISLLAMMISMPGARSVVLGSFTSLQGWSKSNISNLADCDRYAIVIHDDRLGDVACFGHPALLANWYFEATHAREITCAGRAVRTSGSLYDVRDCEIEEPKAFLVDVDLVLGQFSTDGDDLRDSRHGEDLVPEIELGK